MMFPSIFCGKDSPKAFHALPGECYWYTHPEISRYGLGIKLHLGSVVPSGLLAVLQFTPSIRQRYPTFHKLAGYTATTGVIYGNIGVWMLMDKAFGGSLATQSISVVLAIMTTSALLKGISEARQGHITNHRAWMLRAWSYLGAILTMRPLLALSSLLMTIVPAFEQWDIITCAEILDMMTYTGKENATSQLWPACNPRMASYDPTTKMLVRVNSLATNPVEKQAGLRISFGPMAWVALMIHVLAVEAYLNSSSSSARKPQQAMRRSLVVGEKEEGKVIVDSDRSD